MKWDNESETIGQLFYGYVRVYLLLLLIIIPNVSLLTVLIPS